ncbi:unnamed protein product [Absidia cylindrospora]
MAKPKIQSSSCAFGADELDDWLESDLRQSGILPSNSNKSDRSWEVSTSNDWKSHSFCDGSDDKTVVGDSEVDQTKHDTAFNTASSSIQLAPILKAFLTTLQQHQHHQYQQGIMIPPLLPLHLSPSSPISSATTTSSSLPSLSSLTPDSINPLHISNTARVPSINNTKASSTSTTTTTKRHREMNDTPGAVDVLDPLVLKRLKNTDAARRSRQRKLMKMEGLQSRVAELEKHNGKLQSQVAMAENERDAAKIKESRRRERVATLEAQLAEAHQSLLVNQEPFDQEKLGDDGDSQSGS